MLVVAGGAGDVATLGGGQEERRGSNLLGPTKAVERRRGCKARPYRVTAFLRCRLRVDDRRVNRAGADSVDTDATILEFRRPRAHKRTNTGFCCAVSGVARNALERDVGRNQDDRAAIAEKRKCLLDCEEKSAHVG